MPPPFRALFVADPTEPVETLLRALTRDGLPPTWDRASDALKLVAASAPGRWDAVVVDADGAALGVEAAVTAARASDPYVPVLVVSARDAAGPALAAVRAGANDYVLKSELGRLGEAVARAAATAGCRAREARRATVVDHARVLIWEADAATLAFTHVSDYCEELLGFPRTDWLRPGFWLDRLHPDDTAAAVHACQSATAAGLDHRIEYRMVRADGGVVWVDDAVRLVAAGGRVVALQGAMIDITMRKRAEAALRESEERLRLALVAARMGTYDWDLTTDTVVWSDTHYELWGYPPGERFPVEYRHFAERLHPDDVGRAEAAIRAARDARTRYANECRIVLPDGSVRWVAGTGEFQYTPDGRAVRMLGVTRDVTEQRRAEEALRLSEARFRAFMDNGPFLAWITEVGGAFEYASARFLDALHLPGGGVTGRSLSEVFPPELAQQYFANNREVAATGRVLETTEPAVLADGSPGQFLVYKFPIPEPGRLLVGGVAIDITERARLQAVLEMRDRAIRAIRQGIVITDPNLPDNPIVYASPGFEQLTGYPVAEVIGKNCRFLRGPGTDADEVARVGAAVRNRVPYSGELLNYRKDGTTFWNQLSIAPVFDGTGRLTHFVGIQTDVTARRDLQEQLRQSQKLEAVGRLAGGVAHDFNNLLTVINGYSEWALGETPAGHRLREPLETIRHAGERAAALTSQLLAFSRKAIVAPKVLDLNDAVGSITKMLRRLIGEDIALKVVLFPGACRVRIDPGQLEQVIMNLAVNARDALPRGGDLTVETALVPDTGPATAARLVVSDTGCGMCDDVKARIFEPFFTTKAVGKGTGLGLAMVYGIVQQAGGTIRVESAVGRGATFTIELPVVPDSTHGTEEPTATGLAPRGTETVLLVEDEDAVRGLAKVVLELQGYTVLEAATGEQARALAAACDRPIHLLVTDVVMPNLGGRDLAAALRATRPELPVLFVSGYTDDALVRHGLEVSELAFLQKPFTPLSLARKVREVLDAHPSAV